MLNRFVPRTASTCVWMNAGVLTYKLCDRNFDCEHCPLDAALRGVSRPMGFPPEAPGELGRRAATFPDDRLYSSGHTWLQPVAGNEGRIRFGLDGFAASFLPRPRHIRRAVPPGPLDRGEELCEIEFDAGVLTLDMPVYAQVSRWNRALEDDPTALVTAPYDKGWIVELVLAAKDELENLFMAQAAQKQARLDGRRFRRRLALHLLVNDDEPGPALPEDGRLLTDLRQILGEPRFVAFLRELVH